jgi:quercetin 2,3-dioxygenase
LNNQPQFKRAIKNVQSVEAVLQGPIHKVGMVIEPGSWEAHDPFLMLAEDWFETGVFDVHPHRGQETVTYVIEGNLEHFDNKAGGGTLGPGDVQWMTAGKGVIHKEDPAPGQVVHSLQLWVNLPRAQKYADPRYQNIKSTDVPVRKEEGCLIRIFSGSSGGIHAATKNYVPVTMLEINLEPGATITQDLPADYNGFLYVLEGNGLFGENEVRADKSQVMWLDIPLESVDVKESEIKIRAIDKLKVLLYAGRPLHEPVVQYGPFVMNTKAEIQQAFADYQSGKFGQ